MSKLIKNYDLYEVVKIPFPFSDMNKAKIRPALIISNAERFSVKTGHSIMTMITSIKQFRKPWATDVIIKNLKSAGLPYPSLVRFKLFTLDHRLIIEKIGNLSREDCFEVQQKLKDILSL